MRFIVHAELLGFYLRASGLTDSSAGAPDRQLAAVHGNGRIIDVSSAAEKRGVMRGQELRDAKLILGPNGVCVPWRPDDGKTASEKWLTRLLQYADAVQVLTQASALVDLSRHPRPDDAAATLLRDLSRSERLPIRAGIGPSGWLARLGSERCDPRALHLGILPVEPIRMPAEWLAQLPVERLSPLAPEVSQKLRRLGLRQVRDVQRLPYAALEQQFGRQARVIAETAFGRNFESFRANWPLGSLTRSLSLDGCTDALQLDAALGSLASQSAFQLCSKDLAADALRLYVSREGADGADEVQTAERPLKKPIQTASEIHTALRQLLGEISLDAPILRVKILMWGLKRTTLRQGAMAFDRTRDASMLGSALSRIQNAYGQDAVMRGSQVVVSRERRVLKAWGDVYGWK